MFKPNSKGGLCGQLEWTSGSEQGEETVLYNIVSDMMNSYLCFYSENILELRDEVDFREIPKYNAEAESSQVGRAAGEIMNSEILITMIGLIFG